MLPSPPHLHWCPAGCPSSQPQPHKLFPLVINTKVPISNSCNFLIILKNQLLCFMVKKIFLLVLLIFFMKYWLKCLNLGICTSIKWIRNRNTPIHSYSYFSKIFSFSAWTCSQIQTVEEMKFQMVPMMKLKILMAEVLSMNMTMGGATESSACLHSETTPEHFYTTQFPQIYLWRCWHPVTNSPVLSFTVMLWSAIPGPTWRRSMQQFSAVIWEDCDFWNCDFIDCIRVRNLLCI